MEIKYECKTFEIDQSCDCCGIGMMRPTGRAHPTAPPLFEHECTECHTFDWFKIQYPKIVHESKQI